MKQSLKSFILIKSLIFFVSCSSTSNKSKQKFMIKAKQDETIISKEVIYWVPSEVGPKRLKGFLAMPDGQGPFPGVLVVHEWWGQTEYPRQRARMLAQEGFVAFAVDMYGDGTTFDHPKGAKAFSSKVMKDMDSAQKNFTEALDVLKKEDKVDPNNLAAIGYCFGGAIVLEMARRKVDLKVVASYHGNLTPLAVNPVSPIKTKIFIFNGKKDPMVNQKTIDQVERNLIKASVRYKLINYENARHGFTNKSATKLGKEFNLPLAYDKDADMDSWNKTIRNFKLILK